MPQTILITGAAGEIGSDLRRSLSRPDLRLRLLDISNQPAAGLDEDVEIIIGSFTDPEVILRACEGVDAVLHLGSLLGGATWPQYLDTNIHGTYVVLEAARLAGVPHVIYASSHHAVGFIPKGDGDVVDDYAFPRPDSYYGVAKVASEAMCSLYTDRHGLRTTCIRICSYRQHPDDVRCLWNWLSPADMTRFVEAALALTDTRFRVVWGVSNNTRRLMSLDEAHAMGFRPQDDAEDYAEAILANATDGDLRATQNHLLGGLFTAPAFDAEARL